MKDFKIACVQIASGPKIKANLLEVSKYISEAKNKGANIVLLPENFAVMVKDDIMYLDYQEKFGDGIIQNFISDEAKKNDIWIIAGTIPIKSKQKDKVLSR